MEMIKIGGSNIALNYENKNDKVLFILLGEALTEIQCFETCIYSLLSGIQDNEKKITFIDSFEKNERKTLGQLIYDLDKYIKDENIKRNLIEVRDRRNYLVHNILKRYGWPLMSNEDYLKSIKEIVEIRDFINSSEPIITKYIRDNKILDILIFEFNEKRK
ncbi:MAG TPA: hypothetical protein ENJ95_13320 [Bacteroidetes bacterium]|nr:hypothetical protein [Bacteroidota bacterium]